MAHFLQETASGLPERVDAGTDGDADRLCAGGLRPVGADSDGNGHRPVGTTRYRSHDHRAGNYERRYDGRGRLLFPQTARGGGILLT